MLKHAPAPATGPAQPFGQGTMRTASGRLLKIILCAGVLCAATAAAADPMTNDMDLVYARYHMAIRAAELCRGVIAGDAIWRKWASYIDEKTDHELGAGERLSVIDGAKSDATYMVRREGCKSDDVLELLVLYDDELAAMAKR
jgi:hypothetical protein